MNSPGSAEPTNAADRVLAYCAAWEMRREASEEYRQFHITEIVNEKGTVVLDWRDLMALVGIAKGEEKNALTDAEKRQGRIRSSAGQSAYLELATRAMEGYRQANSRQIDTIGRLMQKLHDIRKILRDRKEDRNIIEARHTKAMIERAIDER